MTTSSITAALPGTASSTSRGQSCPSACAIGHIGPDQRDLVLLIFQAMDAAGKDGTIKHVIVGRQPAGLPSVFLQSSIVRRARSRFPVALYEIRAGAWPNWDLQPQLLRGNAGGARTPRIPREADTATRPGHQKHLERTLPGHPQLQPLSKAQCSR